METLRIMGIDPGIAIVGVGVVERAGNAYKEIYHGAITTPAHTPIERRLIDIYGGLNALLDKYRPDAVSVEELFFNNNAKTVIAVGQARGVILLAAMQAGVPIFEYTPLQVKQALTGYGRAEKKQIQQMMKAMLGLEAVPKPDDVADALAIAVCHGNSVRFNQSALSTLMKSGGKV